MKIQVLSAIAIACALGAHSWSQNPEPKRINKAIGLLSQDQPIYY